MHGVTSRLSFLHAKNIVHCDLKAANVFVGDNGDDGLLVKLGDFGTTLFDFAQFSVSVMPAATNTDNSVMCTAAYTAPELLERGAKPSFESDVYSLAMVMIESFNSLERRVDTHKVPEEAGGTQYGLIVQFTFDTDKKETVIDNIVEWISIRMRASIQNYSTSLHSLVLLQVIKKSGTAIFEFDISDVDDEELLNASLEAERNKGYLPSVVNDHSE
ncbi:serine threonine kinase [Paramuricea clavata]|uniref:Serine threonine kinase n=1 Tax=Paramuricea clavata TaxID=317549 RepID=A0A7D9K3V7_PARCT|nr:serine threonine kinase [Paramuricea clavata]